MTMMQKRRTQQQHSPPQLLPQRATTAAAATTRRRIRKRRTVFAVLLLVVAAVQRCDPLPSVSAAPTFTTSSSSSSSSDDDDTTTTNKVLVGSSPVCFQTRIPVGTEDDSSYDSNGYYTSNSTSPSDDSGDDDYYGFGYASNDDDNNDTEDDDDDVSNSSSASEDMGEAFYVIRASSTSSASANDGMPERLPQCYDGTTLNATFHYDNSAGGGGGDDVSDQSDNGRLQRKSQGADGAGSSSSPIHRVYTGSTLHFGIQLQVNVSEIVDRMFASASDDESDGINNSSSSSANRHKMFHFHARFLLCDAFKVGSCTRILHTVVQNTSVPVYSAIDTTTLLPGSSSAAKEGALGAAATDDGTASPGPPTSLPGTVNSKKVTSDANTSDIDNPTAELQPVDPPPSMPSSSSSSALGQIEYVGSQNHHMTNWSETTSLLGKNDQLFRAAVNVTLHVPSPAKFGAFFVVGEALIDFFEINNDDSENGTATTPTTIQRITIASTVPEYAFYVSSPPLILGCSLSMKVYLGIVIGLAGSFALASLIFVVWHRKHVVMTLAQGPFLATLAGSCLVVIVFSFTFLPTRDVFCNLNGPLVLLPLHVAAAIMVARIWRVYTTLSAANLLGRRSGATTTSNLSSVGSGSDDVKDQSSGGSSHTSGSSSAADKAKDFQWRWVQYLKCNHGVDFMHFLTLMARFPFSIAERCSSRCCKQRRKVRAAVASPPSGGGARQSSLRQVATTKETASLVVALTLPQLALQVFGATYYRREVVLEYTADGDVGFQTCTENGTWVYYVGFAMALLLFLLMVFVAYLSRLLPSAFNETPRVFQAAAIATLLAMISFPLIAVTDHPGNSPDITVRSSNGYCLIISPCHHPYVTYFPLSRIHEIQVFFRTLLSIGIAVTVLVALVLPKIRRVTSGEKVVVSTLLDARFSTWNSDSDARTTTTNHTVGGGIGGSFDSSGGGTAAEEVRSLLDEGDPLPRSVEKHVVHLQDILSKVTLKWYAFVNRVVLCSFISFNVPCCSHVTHWTVGSALSLVHRFQLRRPVVDAKGVGPTPR